MQDGLDGSATIPHKQILHPMPFYRIFGFPKFRKSGKSGMLKIRISGFSGIPEIRIPEVLSSGDLEIRFSGFPDFQIFENPGIRRSENPDFRTSRKPQVEFSGASDAGHRRCPDPSKKHGDLISVQKFGGFGGLKYVTSQKSHPPGRKNRAQ